LHSPGSSFDKSTKITTCSSREAHCDVKQVVITDEKIFPYTVLFYLHQKVADFPELRDSGEFSSIGMANASFSSQAGSLASLFRNFATHNKSP
jgi:hypothetical protein